MRNKIDLTNVWERMNAIAHEEEEKTFIVPREREEGARDDWRSSRVGSVSVRDVRAVRLAGQSAGPPTASVSVPAFPVVS